MHKHTSSGYLLSGEESVLFSCQESSRKEEKEDQVNQSYQGTDYLLAETSECLYDLKVGNVSSWFLCYFLMKTSGKLPDSSLHQTEDNTRPMTHGNVMNVYCCQVLSVLCLKTIPNFTCPF